MNPPATTVSPFVSQKMKFWSFIAMVGLVFVHGYTLEPRYLQPWTQPESAVSAAGFVEYLVANALLRFRIPLLFLVSGYLFALGDTLPHGQRMQKRLRTLGLPYLAWSLLTLIVFVMAESNATFRAWVTASGVAQLDATTLTVQDHGPGQWLLRVTLMPLSYQLWFIRALLIYNLIYPQLLRWVTGPRSAPIFFALAGLAWLASMHLFLLEAEGLLFFSLGIWMQRRGFDIASPARAWRPLPWCGVWLAAAALKTALAFGLFATLGLAADAPGNGPAMVLLHKLAVFAGLVAAWYGSDALVRTAMGWRWFAWCSGFAFVIYVSHAPLVAVLIDPVIALTGSHLATFLLLPLALIATAIVGGALLRRLAPSLYGLLTGGRGL